MEKKCRTCDWREKETDVCLCPTSPYSYDEVGVNDSCKMWFSKKQILLFVDIIDPRKMIKEKVEEIFSDEKIADDVYMKMCEIEKDERMKRFSEINKQSGEKL